jgi:hypothetical protein
MQIRKFFTRKLAAPVSNKTNEIEVPQLWEVRWFSRQGNSQTYLHLVDAKPEIACFFSQEEAESFRESLLAAFALLRYSGSGVHVEVTKVK